MFSKSLWNALRSIGERRHIFHLRSEGTRTRISPMSAAVTMGSKRLCPCPGASMGRNGCPAQSWFPPCSILGRWSQDHRLHRHSRRHAGFVNTLMMETWRVMGQGERWEVVWQKFGKETGGNYTAESEQSSAFSGRGREAYLLRVEATLLLPKGCVVTC